MTTSVVAVVTVSPGGPLGDVVQSVTAVLTLTGGVVLWLWSRSRQEDPAPVDGLASASDALTAAVLAQWEQAAAERRLRYPTPIPVRWRWSSRAVTGPVEEALGAAGHARFAPLPGIAAATTATLAEGGIADLFGVYAGLESGRLIVLGGAGRGKSAVAILTVLDALKHRQALDVTRRARVPVPVLLTAHDWNPRQQRLDEWLIARLTTEYPFLRSAAYGRHAAARMVQGGQVALVLDGFDEIADDLRPVAIRALDQHITLRLMLLTRTGELVDAVAGGHLQGAAALELLPVPSTEAADYLIRCQVHPPPPGWQRLAGHLRAAPGSALSSALDNPLMLTLVRDTFPAAAELDALTTREFTERAEVEAFLLGRVVPTAYQPRPGGEPVPYSAAQARRWLGFLAAEMNRRGTRDLAWWHIRQWAPAPVRAFIAGLPAAPGAGLPLGVAYGMMFGPKSGLVAGTVCGVANAVGVGLAMGRGVRPRPALAGGLAGALASALTAGIAFALAVGTTSGIADGIGIGLVAALGLGLPSGIAATLTEARRRTGPRRLRPLRWKAIATRGSMTVGLAFGVVLGLADGLAFGLTAGLPTGLLAGAVIGLAAMLLFGVFNSLVQGFADAAGPMDPVTCWRRDRRSGLVEGLAYGLIAGVGFGLPSGIVGGAQAGWLLGIGTGLGEALAVTIAVSQSWSATVAFVLLGRTGVFPHQGIRFLDDAHRRGVLRTVGSVYQFRHARLQDQLARDSTRPAE
ncbi:NACHT domain-containing protein [Sphaerisporangium krabiense]|uniref:NACHT domain-containing protein n=1 Tax=Sphaerisporangium krabiense TaxID=763782 RepID=A0A7W8ZA32_9ACTN|nr:hypothetical protein [Sphaerisporangium krabiense]MBB5630131.1 hypothetical protein [Sphaerisporangium krabiense]GII65081.1 NACHT domain-containing protein [Sphaerisporangium krabiense]